MILRAPLSHGTADLTPPLPSSTNYPTPVLPPLFLERLREIVPAARYEAVLATFAAPQGVGFRLNGLRLTELEMDPESVESRLQVEGVPFERVAGVPGAYAAPADARAALMASAPYAAGAIYLQNVASQLPALALDPRPDERVLDLCAAPGSKAGQLAALMQGSGELVAVEKARPRYYRMLANLREQGVRNARTVLGSGTGYWHREPEAFDRVLLDAPCSTEGRFRADDPETTRYWSERKIKEMRAVQERLLFGAVQALRPGGMLVYSTCTFAPEENEAVVDRALRTFGSALETVDVGLPVDGPAAAAETAGLSGWRGRSFDERLQSTRRVLPDGLLEGFFVARLRKTASTLRGKEAREFRESRESRACPERAKRVEGESRACPERAKRVEGESSP